MAQRTQTRGYSEETKSSHSSQTPGIDFDAMAFNRELHYRVKLKNLRDDTLLCPLDLLIRA